MGAWWKGYCKRAYHPTLNARSWQSGRINEGMTPEQCHAVHCNSQQIEGSVGWDRHSSGDLHNRQMNGQDERSRRIYNQRDLTKRRRAIRKTPESSSGAVSVEEKENSSSDKARGWTLTLPLTTPLTILFPNDPAQPLMKSSQRPSS